ncbi:MAG: hypothetical protein JW810_07390 [Sedimentisphaerales bacterium]|nr:hypothetical protein [Sedimentisphaerales bacterium]
MIQFKCPKCGEVMEAPSSLQGQTLSCPDCKQTIVVPRVDAADEAEAAGAVGAAQLAPLPDPLADEDEVVRFTCSCGQPVKTAAEHAGKIGVCPVCKREIPIPHPS